MTLHDASLGLARRYEFLIRDARLALGQNAPISVVAHEQFGELESDYAAWGERCLAEGDDPLDGFDLLTLARLDTLRLFTTAPIGSYQVTGFHTYGEACYRNPSI